MNFNINQSVRVRLTDLGRRIHRQQWEELRAQFPKLGNYIPLKEDAEGWSTWQLWTLMRTFGEHIGMAAELPFETDIHILENT